MVRFVYFRLFVDLRLMSWKHLQSLFQIHIITYLIETKYKSIPVNPDRFEQDVQSRCGALQNVLGSQQRSRAEY